MKKLAHLMLVRHCQQRYSLHKLLTEEGHDSHVEEDTDEDGEWDELNLRSIFSC